MDTNMRHRQRRLQTSVPLSDTLFGVEELDTALGKAVAILRSFGQSDTVLPLAELVRRTGLPKATAHRVAGALVGHRMLDKGPGGYRLSGGLFELGMRAATERTLLEVAAPFLQDLSERTHETVHLGERQGHEVVYLAKIGGHRQAVSPSRTGGRMPMYCTAIGKVLLAHCEEDLRREILSGPLVRRTPRTVVAPGMLRRQLGEVLDTGVAYENEESRIGLRCVAVPVFDSGGRTVVAAMSVAGPVSRFVPDDHVNALRTSAASMGPALSARHFTR
jgi:DNA-binding IclR family transcriptional regulator